MNFSFSIDIRKIFVPFPGSEEAETMELIAKGQNLIYLLTDIEKNIKNNPAPISDGMKESVGMIVSSLMVCAMQLLIKRADLIDGRLPEDLFKVDVDMTSETAFDNYNWDEAGRA